MISKREAIAEIANNLICFKCKKQVEEVTMYEMLNKDGKCFSVRCHGQQETAEINNNFLDTMDQIGLDYAFKPKIEIEVVKWL